MNTFRIIIAAVAILSATNAYFASLLGWHNEMWSPSSVHGKNMDLWNNAVGRELARKYRSKNALASALAKALKDGELIAFPEDARVYGQAAVLKPSGDFSVEAIKENQNGTNELYFDFNLDTVLSKDGFVAENRGGKYPAYSLRTRNGTPYPVARSNKSGADNLG